MRAPNLLYLDPDDVLGSIRTKLSNLAPGTIDLVVPYGLGALRNPVGMRLLVRELRRRSINATLRTTDGRIAQQARAAGLATAGIDRSLPIASRSDVVRSAAAYEAHHAEVAARAKEDQSRLLAGAGVLAAFGAVAALVAAVVLPAAVVTIVPAATESHQVLTVKASTLVMEPDVQGLVLPARALTTEVRIGLSDTYHTTQQAPCAKAVGRVTFTNLTPNAVEVPPRARVATAQGIAFETNSRVTVPAEGSLDVAVTAVEGGVEGNVPAGSVTVVRENNLQRRVTVTNAAAFQRGTSVDRVVIRDEDVVELRRRASDQALTEGVRQLRQNLPSDLSFYDQSARLVISQEVLDRLANDNSAELRINLQGTVSVVAFRGRELNQLAARHLAAEARGREADGAGPSIRILGLASADPDAVTFHVETAAAYRARITQDQVKAMVRGRPAPEAAVALSDRFDLAQPPRVQTWPFWVSSVPNWPWRVDVRIQPVAR